MKQKSFAVVLPLAAVFLLLQSAVANASDAPDPTARGRRLYLQNCAHCHADDATGDEGPDLHHVKKTDARLTTIIKQGIKGEMPAFGKKLGDGDVRDLIAYIRSLSKVATKTPSVRD
jgi:cytochrome c oxidase cbb3-type subunit 3